MNTGTVGRYSEIGARIRLARQRRGLSQERFAPIVGVTRRHLIRLENGEHLPSPALRARLAEHTGEPAESFSLDGDDEESDPVADLVAVIRRLVRAEMKSNEPSGSREEASLGSSTQGA